MARSSEGILIGFPQIGDAGEIATRVTDKNVDRANNLMQQGKENVLREERQGWDRQYQPYRLQQAADEQKITQMKLDEAADTVKRTSAAREEWEKLAARFGTDDEPTGEEIMLGQANMMVASRNPAGASSAINTLAQMKQGDAKAKSLQSLVVKTAPLLGQLKTPQGLEKFAAVLDDPAHRDALSTTTWQDMHKALIKGYEKVYPPQAAEAMQQYRLHVTSGMDRRKAWDLALSNRPEAEDHFGQKGNLPDEIKNMLEGTEKRETEEAKQGEIGDRQERITAQRKAADLEKAVKVQEMRAKSARDLAEYNNAARRGLVTLSAQVRQHVNKGEFKEAVGATSKAIASTQKEIAALTKQMKDAKDEDLETIQGKLDVQYALLAPLQDRLTGLSDAAAAKVPGGAAPAGGTPKVTPEPGAPKAADTKKASEALKKGIARFPKGADHNAELLKAINALGRGGVITSKEQATALYNEHKK